MANAKAAEKASKLELPLHAKLTLIQDALAVPKGQRNEYGGYNYRSAEDIYQALKPLLKEYGLTLTVTDVVAIVGDRNYVRSTAVLTDGESTIKTEAFAREQDTVKGQIQAQITGSASSYARKYALCGMFLIDGEADPDATNTHGKEQRKRDRFAKLKELKAEAVSLGISEQGIASWISATFGKPLAECEAHEIAETERHIAQLITDKKVLDARKAGDA